MVADEAEADRLVQLVVEVLSELEIYFRVEYYRFELLF